MAAQGVNAAPAVIDGEIVALDAHGLPRVDLTGEPLHQPGEPLRALLDGSGLLLSRELPQMHKPRFATRPGPRRYNSFPTRRE